MTLTWGFRNRLRRFFRSSMWVVPAISTLAAFVCSPLTRMLDRSFRFQLLYFSDEGVRALAGIVSSAMLSCIVFFFSVLLLTVQLASSTLSPRIIARPFRSRILKTALGLFVFSFIYSVALVARGTEGNIGQLAAALVVVLTLVSICVFLYVVEQVSKQLRPATVIADVASEGLAVISTVYPKMLENSLVEAESSEVLPGTPTQVIRHEDSPGVVQAVDYDYLLATAIGAGCTIEVVPQVGDFVATGDPVFHLYGEVAIDCQELLDHVLLDRERTLEQDPAFAFRIIVDIALKALSPAINDPTTAVLALDQIHNLLRQVGRRQLNTGLVCDSTGQLRLVYRTPDWADFVLLALTEIRQFGASSTQVMRRVRAMLEDLIQALPPGRSSALRQELDALTCTITQAFAVPQDKTLAESPDSQGLGGRQSLHQKPK